MILERLSLALLILLAGWLTFRAVNQIRLKRRLSATLGLEAYQPGTPAVLLFSSPDCIPCRTVQRPEAERARDLLDGRLQLIEIDVYDRPALSDAWGVLSLPTTFIIDSQGRPRRVNHGVTRAAELLSQLAGVADDPAPAQSAAQRAAADTH